MSQNQHGGRHNLMQRRITNFSAQNPRVKLGQNATIVNKGNVEMYWLFNDIDGLAQQIYAQGVKQHMVKTDTLYLSTNSVQSVKEIEKTKK